MVDAKHAWQTYLVGGAVRDTLLGRAVVDKDWVVVGTTPATMLDLGFHQVGQDFPVFLHPQSKEEYALARTERKHGQGHRGFAVHASPEVTLEADLARRDLTVNAMAQDADGVIIDPYGGREDLQRRVLRHVSEAFVEDPLRVFRVARFAAQLPEFSVAEATQRLLQEMCASGELRTLSAERVWQECAKALAAVAPQRFIDVLEECGGLTDWLPELLGALVPVDQPTAAARFAWLSLDAEQLQALTARLRVPKAWQQLASDRQLYAPVLLAFPEVAVEAVYAALNATAAVHDTERLNRLVALIANPTQRDVLKANLPRMVDEIKQVRLPAAHGLEGEAYGNALQQLRRDALHRLLKEISIGPS